MRREQGLLSSATTAATFQPYLNHKPGIRSNVNILQAEERNANVLMLVADVFWVDYHGRNPPGRKSEPEEVHIRALAMWFCLP